MTNVAWTNTPAWVAESGGWIDRTVTDESGVYAWLNTFGECVYAGKASHFRDRSRTHWRKWACAELGPNAAHWQLMTFPVPDGLRIRQVENAVLADLRPARNKQFHPFRGTTHDAELSEIIVDHVRARTTDYAAPGHPRWCRLCAEELSPRRIEEARARHRSQARAAADYLGCPDPVGVAESAYETAIANFCQRAVADFARRVQIMDRAR